MGELVLVVDHERPVRNMIGCALRNHGFRVVTASDGVDVVARFMTFGSEIKVVVTDVVMPRLDGPAVVRAIRKGYPNTRIIAITDHAPDEVGERSQTVDIDVSLARPFTCDALLRAMHDLVGRGENSPMAGADLNSA